MSASLIGHLLAAINGAAVVRGSSWLRDAMDSPVLPAGLDLIDDPVPGRPLPPRIPGMPRGLDPARAEPWRVRACLEDLARADLEAAVDAPIETLERAVALAHDIAGPASPLGIVPAHAVALAIELVQRPRDRDLAIQAAIDGTDAAAATLAIGTDLAALDEARPHERFLGEGEAPDADRLRNRLERWTAIAEAAPTDARAPLLVICGYLHFFLGRGRTAARCAQAAIDLDPELTMAPLLLQVVDAKGAPDWVVRDLRPAAVP